MNKMNGTLDHSLKMTPKEQKALKEFKQRLEAAGLLKTEYDNHYLLKWLKARSFDAKKAFEMFKTSLAYRERMGCDRLIQDYDPPEVLKKYLPGGFCGYDKEGSPVLVELYGYTDMKGILHSCKRSDIEKTKLLLGEKVMKDLKVQTEKLGHTVDGMTVILDLEKVGTWMLWGPGLQMYAHMGRVLQDNYPEIVKRTLIVNAPGIFPVLWKIVKPLITEEMKRKVCILGGEYKKELLKHVDSDQLPEFLGGSLVDDDGNPRCPSKICQGGTVPESYYLKNLSQTENLKTCRVQHGEKLKIECKVTQPNSILRWEFKTEGYDIGFGVSIETESGEKSVIPMERVNSHFVPEDGALDCNQTGTYILIFDNSYSWIKNKALYYNIDILQKPDDSIVNDLDTLTQGGSWVKIASRSENTRL